MGCLMIKKIVRKIKTSIWLYPTIYSLIALLLSVLVTIFEDIFAVRIYTHMSGLFYTSSSLAQAVLGIIAAAFITIAIFTFSTTMMVLTMYSSQFTPRVVENFLYNQTTMKSFGIFLSGFIYAITSLLFLKPNEIGNPVISASIGIIYIIVGLVYFLIFIHNVSVHIQASGLILRLHEKASNNVKKYRDFTEQAEVLREERVKELTANKMYLEVYSQSDGYIQEVDYQGLQKITQNFKCIICLRKVVGQFISRETSLAEVYHEKTEPLDDKAAEMVRTCITIGNKRTEEQDPAFAIQKIVEIAVKALSPGVNDPNTAIHCLHIIGLLLRDLADVEKGYILLKEKSETEFTLCEAYDFEKLLFDAYTQIEFYGQSDILVMIAVFKSLRSVKTRASSENGRIINEYALRLFEKQSKIRYDKYEFNKINKEYKDFKLVHNEEEIMAD